MFAHSRNLAITGGHFVDVRGQPVSTALEKLQREGAPSAFHNSSARFDPPKCHPNTRVAVLEYLMGWIFGHNDPEALILWLYGPAGAGKSAILQTIAELCFERKVLLASFFFGRSDPSRNHFKPLVATIAYQIAVTIPVLKQHIESVIEHDPAVFHKSIATQIQSLVIEPLKRLAASGFFNDLSACARLILIDAVDECDDPRMQSMILRAIADALRGCQIPLIFLISSRPEQSIALTFNSSSLAGLWRSVVLDGSFKPDEDIRLFLDDSFKEIKASHPLRHHIPEAWPAQSDIDKLVRKSSGQFIFASVVVKYVKADDDRPSQRLEVIMGLRPARSELPFAELDAVYTHILASCKHPGTVLRILELLICRIENRACCIEMLLDLEPGDVEIALTPLHSVLTVTQLTVNPLVKISLSHASFGDFLVDPSRSTRFYIDKLIVGKNTLSTCINKLMHPPSFASNTISLQLSSCYSDHLLFTLEKSLASSLIGLPLTETVENILKEFSLPHMWIAWSPGSDIGRMFPKLCSSRTCIVSIFLHHIKFQAFPITDPEAVYYADLYAFHLSSFEPLFKSALVKYYHNEELTSIIILLTTIPFNDFFLRDGRDHLNLTLSLHGTVQNLMQLTEEAIFFDSSDAFGLCLLAHGSRFINTHYQHLFTHSDTSAGGLDGNKYARTALRILNFLCSHSPRPLSYCYRTRKSPHKQRTYCHFLRKQRVEKYRYGVVLSLPRTEREISYGNKIIPCEVGLRALPEILEKSSKSPELVNFIRTHGKDIAFLPKWTRMAIRAMHEYLDRPDDDDDDVDME
ncbi:hypothetical protein BJ912DRAFT_979528 [Pholiota molesta]|nr:hypothetical protein BJ912DRAFT_979528 [Pholiota molesta]